MYFLLILLISFCLFNLFTFVTFLNYRQIVFRFIFKEFSKQITAAIIEKKNMSFQTLKVTVFIVT